MWLASKEPSRRSQKELGPRSRSSPIALRFGASDVVALALLRAGARPRAIAKLLASRLPSPPDGLDDDGLRNWGREQIDGLEEHLDEIADRREGDGGPDGFRGCARRNLAVVRSRWDESEVTRSGSPPTGKCFATLAVKRLPLSAACL